MNTFLIRLVQSSGETPIGTVVVDWIATPPIFATVNGLRKTHYAWAGGRGEISDESMRQLRRRFPLVTYWQDCRAGRDLLAQLAEGTLTNADFERMAGIAHANGGQA